MSLFPTSILDNPSTRARVAAVLASIWLAISASAQNKPDQSEPDQPAAESAEADETFPSAQWIKHRKAWRAKSAVERQEIREQLTAARHQAALDSLPKGWSSIKSPHYLVLYRCDKRYAKRLTAAAEAFWTWLDGEFGEISDEHVRHPILRICADFDDFQKTLGIEDDTEDEDEDEDLSVGPWIPEMTFADVDDVVTFYEGGSQPRMLGPVFQPILHRYLVDKDPLLFRYIPQWLRVGLEGMLEGAQLRGRKLEWKTTDMQRGAIANAVRADSVYPVDQVLRLDDPNYDKLLENDAAAPLLFGSLVRYLMTDGRRNKLLKGLVPEIMTATIRAAAENPWPLDAKLHPNAPAPEDETSAEREERLENERDAWDERRTKVFEAMPDFTKRGSERAWMKIRAKWIKAAG